MPAIVVRGLRKSYGDTEAVRGIDLEISRGEIVAFLGPNGAGKTTTVEILEGFLPRSAGHVAVLGVDPAEGRSAWRDRIGIVLQESAPDPGLTVRESLELYSGYYTRPRSVAETMRLIGLDDKADVRATALSGGQRRRLDFGLALIGDPELIFLDEPTTGFDPSARRAAWHVINDLRELGKTIFLTTHYMEEAERLADRIAVIVDGRVVAEGTPQTLGGRDQAETVISFTLPDSVSAADLPAAFAADADISSGQAIAIRTATALDHLELLSMWARAHDVEVSNLEVTRPTLEDIYLRLTSRDTKES
ncbi:MAG: ABC transporter ATP-binding protein [Gaiellaceae bacterium]